jgi:hypothetical protein
VESLGRKLPTKINKRVLADFLEITPEAVEKGDLASLLPFRASLESVILSLANLRPKKSFSTTTPAINSYSEIRSIPWTMLSKI